MKNKKLLKALAAITLSASAAIGAFGLTACGGGHTHDYKWDNTKENEHYKVCAEDGEIDESTRGQHSYVDGVCVCGRTEQGEVPGPGPGPITPVPDDSVEVYKADFTEDKTFTLADEAETEAPEKGIYGTLAGSYAENADAATNLTLDVSGGKLNLKDTGKGTVNAYIKIDPIELKKVTVIAEIVPGSENGGWNLLTFLDANGGKIAHIRTNSDKKAGLSVDGSNVTGSTVACSGTIKVVAVLDLAAGTIEVDLKDGAATSSGTITATSFGGVSLMTANGSKDTDVRNISLASLVVKEGSTDLDAEGLKTKLTAKYEGMGVEANYTTNGAALTKAYEDGLAAIENAADRQAAVKAFSDAVAALDAVESDAQLVAKQAAYEKAKTDAVAELNGYKGGAANYNETGEGGNKTAYDAAISSATAAINAVELNGDLNAAKTAINEALATGKTAIDGISDNATLRSAAKEAAKTEIAGYKADEITAIENATVKAAIEKVKTEFPAKVDAAVTLANVKAAVNTAKASIDGQIDSLHLSLADHKTDKKGDLADYVTTVKADLDATADATLISTIDGIVTQTNSSIDAVTEGTGAGEYATEDEAKVAVTHIYDEAVSAIDDAIAAYGLAKSKTAAKAELVAYANTAEVQQPISRDRNLIDELIGYATNDTDLLGLIDAVTTPEDLATTVATCKGRIDAKAAELSNHEYTVTVSGADGVTVAKVKYGGKITRPANPADAADARFVDWYTDDNYDTLFDFENTVVYADTTIYAAWREADVTVTYMVNGEQWKEVPAFSGEVPTLADGSSVVVSGKTFDYWYLQGGDENTPYSPSELEANATVTLVAKLRNKTNADLALEENWVVAATDTSFAPNKLFIVKTAETAGEFKSTSSASINGKSFSAGYNISVAKGGSNSEKPVQFIAKEDIKLTIYVGLAASDGAGTRQGTIYCAVNGVEQEIANSPSRTRLLAYKELNLKAGDVVNLYISVPENASYGAYMWLFGADAEIADTFTNATVNYYGADHTTVFKSVEWNSLKPVTAPAENPVKAGSSLVGWTTTKDGTTVDYTFDENATVEANGTLNLYPVYESAAVTVKFYDKEGAELKSAGVLEGGKIANADIPAADAVTGYRFLGWYTKTEGVFAGQPFDFETALSSGVYTNDTLELYANYKQLQLITVGGDENVTVGTASFYVEDVVTADDVDNAITLASGKEVKEYRLNNGEGEVITLPYTVNANTTVYVVTQDVTSKTVTFNVSDLSSANASGVVYSDALFTVEVPSSSSVGTKKNVGLTANYTTITAKMPDGVTDLTLTKGLVPTGNGGVYTVKNNTGKSITVTVYFTDTDGNFGTKKVTKTDSTVYKIGDNEPVNCEVNGTSVSNEAACTQTITIGAGETCWLYNGGGVRLTLLAVVAVGYPD